jgi:hypothetical protein
MPDDVDGLVDTTGTPDPNDSGGNGPDDTSGNPAWNDLLNEIPQSLHHIVTPHLTKWDQGVQQKFQQIQQQNSNYEPYKDFVDNKVDPQAIQQALAVMGMINEKPDQFYKEMQTFYKDDPRFAPDPNTSQGVPEVDPTQQQQNQQQQPQFNIETDPRFQQMQQQQEIIANFLSSQVTQQQAQQEDAALDKEMKTLETKYGQYDEDYVLGLAQSGIGLEQAVQRYKQVEAKFRSSGVPGSNFPPVVSPNGGVPSTAIDPKTLSRQDTKSLIASYLATQNQ